MKKLLLTLALAGAVATSYAQGTIQFVNGLLTRVKMGDVPVPTMVDLHYGVFWGTSQTGPFTLAMPLGTSSTTTAGIIDAPTPFAIPKTQPGQTVWLQVIAWPASFGTDWEAALVLGGWPCGQTDRRQVTLGPTNGLGTVIWQNATGTSPNRFFPLTVGGLWPDFGTLAVLPLAERTPSGTVGGPFSPDAIVYTLSNIGQSSLTWSVSKGQAWLSLSASTGTLAVGVSTNLTVSVNSNANNLTAGTYSDRVVFAGGSPVGTSREIILRVIALTLPGARLSSTGGFDLTLSGGEPYQAYVIEDSTDLVQWTAISTNSTGADGAVIFSDTRNAGVSNRFYRARTNW